MLRLDDFDLYYANSFIKFNFNVPINDDLELYVGQEFKITLLDVDYTFPVNHYSYDTFALLIEIISNQFGITDFDSYLLTDNNYRIIDSSSNIPSHICIVLENDLKTVTIDDKIVNLVLRDGKYYLPDFKSRSNYEYAYFDLSLDLYYPLVDEVQPDMNFIIAYSLQVEIYENNLSIETLNFTAPNVSDIYNQLMNLYNKYYILYIIVSENNYKMEARSKNVYDKVEVILATETLYFYKEKNDDLTSILPQITDVNVMGFVDENNNDIDLSSTTITTLYGKYKKDVGFIYGKGQTVTYDDLVFTVRDYREVIIDKLNEDGFSLVDENFSISSLFSSYYSVQIYNSSTDLVVKIHELYDVSYIIVAKDNPDIDLTGYYRYSETGFYKKLDSSFVLTENIIVYSISYLKAYVMNDTRITVIGEKNEFISANISIYNFLDELNDLIRDTFENLYVIDSITDSIGNDLIINGDEYVYSKIIVKVGLSENYNSITFSGIGTIFVTKDDRGISMYLAPLIHPDIYFKEWQDESGELYEEGNMFVGNLTFYPTYVITLNIYVNGTKHETTFDFDNISEIEFLIETKYITNEIKENYYYIGLYCDSQFESQWYRDFLNESKDIYLGLLEINAHIKILITNVDNDSLDYYHKIGNTASDIYQYVEMKNRYGVFILVDENDNEIEQNRIINENILIYIRRIFSKITVIYRDNYEEEVLNNITISG